MFFKIRCWDSDYIVEINDINSTNISAKRYKATYINNTLSGWFTRGSFPWKDISTMTRITNIKEYE